MKTGERIALIYGASVLGAAAVSYLRGRQASEVFMDAALHGALVGTVINGVVYYMTPDEAAAARENGVRALPTHSNPEFEEEELEEEYAEDNSLLGGHKDPPNYTQMGTLPPKAVRLLEKVNAEKLYAPMKAGGVKVDALPKDPNLVNQDAA